MKHIKLTFVAIVLGLSLLWLLADTLWPQPFTYFSFRTVFMQYSGVILMGVMSVAMLLALRPKWLEPHLDGLDKMYRLHKWLGITALVVGLAHWWWGKFTKWMVGWGWLVKPAGGAGPELSALESWLRPQRALAETIGEWSFYAAVILLVLALVKRFPYHLFVSTHKLLALTYLAFVYHTLILTKVEYWAQPIGWLLAVLMLGGIVAAVATLLGKIGAKRKVQGRVETLIDYPSLQVLESSIALDDGWPGHQAGQFAFVRSSRREHPHPYTIASNWNPAEPRIMFIVKALGDHTGRLREQLKIGTPVTVEGPYGCFDFNDAQPRQIWVGAGIGITPFIARLKYIAVTPGVRQIDLFHPTGSYDQQALGLLQEHAEAAGVRLHLLIGNKDGLLDGARIREAVPDWRSASIWFCGPAGFGQSLRSDFMAQGLPAEHFHRELFDMR